MTARFMSHTALIVPSFQDDVIAAAEGIGEKEVVDPQILCPSPDSPGGFGTSDLMESGKTQLMPTSTR